ncbi:hypothetical protein [Acaryochloris sp. IP29b_bin.148]|uniref:glycoside hydrolase family 113 n=1 Tax=Acaryochloris sp. IP29b_bin.148 TaxID=2969218 RepID=UPI0026144EED|nr:hypothetical protein [Acaryochloris sp. IP29b_bin.148]
MKMRSRWVILAFLLPILIILNQASPVWPFYLGGIQVNEPNPSRWVQALKTADMNTVEVTVYATQAEWDSAQLKFEAEDQGIIQEIRAAKAAGLNVVLILRIALDHAYPRNHFLWHGLILPHTDQQLTEWFEQYTAFVHQWAVIAEAEGVDILGLGSEMNALTSTQPVTDLPDLERYYLDPIQQRALIHNLLKHKERIPFSELQLKDGHRFASLEAFLEQRLQAWQTWAKQVSYLDSEATAVVCCRQNRDRSAAIANINRRRQRLDHHWRQLIQQTRQVYRGKLTYAANFDQYQSIGFWDALDFIGVNAYFPLRSQPYSQNQRQLQQALTTGWHQVLSDIETFRQAQSITDKPVIFTELGYTRWEQNTLAPWSYSGFSLVGKPGQQKVILWTMQPTNPQERVLAVQALYKTVKAHYPHLLQGILYWKISTQPNHQAVEPFVLILNDSPLDPLQKTLKQFLQSF